MGVNAQVPVHSSDSTSHKDLDSRHMGYVHCRRDCRCTMQSLTQNQWQITNRGFSDLRAEACQVLLPRVQINIRVELRAAAPILGAPIGDY